MRELQHFIDGWFVPSASGRRFANHNPATGKQIAWVAEGGADEIDAAVRAARRASDAWGTLPQSERSQLLRALADAIDARADEFLAAEVADTGKPVALAARIDIPRGSANFHHFAEHFAYVPTECWESVGALNYALRRPLGVVGVIAPWNLPLLLTTWKVAPALAAGNCVVVKPSEETPTTATLLAEVTETVGVPAGVFNLVHGFGAAGAGEALAAHPDIDGVTFTGETATGTHIMLSAAPSLKKLSFELGGKNPNLIFADADLEAALEGTLASSFANQGEVCLCGSRIYVEAPLFEEFCTVLVERATTKVRVGDPTDTATTMGALISAGHGERVAGYLAAARAEGGEFRCGGDRPVDLAAHLAEGTFLAPTVITGLPETARAQREEIFGPVVTVTPFASEEDAIRRANDTHYGLSATIWTRNLDRAHRVAGALRAGIIWVNTWFLRDLRTPFGGFKHSGIGREGGVHSLDFYSELKNVCIKL